MNWLLDTDVICQPAKRKGDPKVIAWLEAEPGGPNGFLIGASLYDGPGVDLLQIAPEGDEQFLEQVGA